MQIIDYDMPYEQFLAIFEGVHAEWIDGVVYQLPHRTVGHKKLQSTLNTFFTCFLKKYNVGHHICAPTLLRVNSVAPARCPDIQVILNSNTAKYHNHAVIGAVDIVIEVISEQHHTMERGDKFIEYEQGGVGEYWIIDPIREEALFYTLESRYFRRRDPDNTGIYHSSRIQNLFLPTDLLWSEPSVEQIETLIQSM